MWYLFVCSLQNGKRTSERARKRSTSSTFGRVEQHLIRNNDPFIQNGPKWTVTRYLSLPICGVCICMYVCMDTLIFLHRLLLFCCYFFSSLLFSSATRRELNTNFRMWYMFINPLALDCYSYGFVNMSFALALALIFLFVAIYCYSNQMTNSVRECKVNFHIEKSSDSWSGLWITIHSTENGLSFILSTTKM